MVQRRLSERVFTDVGVRLKEPRGISLLHYRTELGPLRLGPSAVVFVLAEGGLGVYEVREKGRDF